MIAHIDADSFFASVLVRRNPRLRGKPLLALGMGGTCVIAATYEAKALGVMTGMPLKEALRLAPKALQIPSDFRETAVASHEIEEILSREGPLLEQMSVDEWFLDLSGLPGGEPRDLSLWATNLQRKILQKTSLSVSIGVGPTKLLAKMAGEYKKPAGITILRNDCGEARLRRAGAAPLKEKGVHEGKTVGLSLMLNDRPAAAIPGIGRRRDVHAQAHGWRTAWDFAVADPELVLRLFGKTGYELQLELLGTVVSPVTIEDVPPKSISRARSFLRTNDVSVLWAHTLRHLEYTVLKMRRQNLACREVSFWLRHWDDSSAGGHRKLPQPMNTEEQLRPYIRDLFDAFLKPKKLYSQTGIALLGLSADGSTQYSLFEKPDIYHREQSIQQTLDSLHERFGRNAITRGSAISVSSQTTPALPLSLLE